METLDAGARDAEVINVSGRQRIAYSVDLLARNPMSTELSEVVADALSLFEQSHDRLLTYAHSSLTLLDIYKPSAASGLDADTRAFIAAAWSAVEGIAEGQDVAGDLDDLQSKAMGPLLVDLNRAVTSFETIANDRAGELERLQEFALLAAILIVLVEAVVIFWPAQMAVDRSMSAMEASNKTISETNSKLNYQLHVDQLTGVYNRHGFDKEVTRIKSSAHFETEQLAVFVIDLDDFKGVNDRLGHATGDIILKHVGRQLQELQQGAHSIGDQFVAARFGGDEFMVCALVGADSAQGNAKAIADLIIEGISQPIRLKDSMHHTKCSIGYAFIASAVDDNDRALIDADLALLEAKSSGKSRAACFEPHIRKTFENKSAILDDFDDAIERGDIQAFFQPQVCLNTGQLVGFEALARWQHPTLGLLMPGQFLPPLVKSRRTHDLDIAVLRSGLKLAQKLRSNGYGLAPVSFNASAGTLRAPTFIDDLRSVMLECGTSSDMLKIEVLETVLIETEDDLALNALARLQSIGIGVELDDFGGGHSSLALLGMFPFDGAKVDRSIISRLDDPRFAAIAKSISMLGESLDMSWVAEGIEKHSEFAKLRSLGFARGQGYVIAKPISPSELPNWLRAYGAKPSGTGVSQMQLAEL